jgi:hypothetical protein
MTLSQAPGAIKRFRRTPWRFQRTFPTPLKNLRPFVAAIVAAHAPLAAATVTIEQVVFESKHLRSLLAQYSLPPDFGEGWAITASGQNEVGDLLEAALGDWVDFIFVPTPKPFVIYADHDEYTTLFANTKSNLNRVVESLKVVRFKMVQNWERKF